MAKGSGGGGSAPTVARAYVAIIPTTKGAQKEISKSLIPEMEAASEDAGKAGGKSLTGSLGSALSAGVSKVAAAAKVVAGAGVAALGALTTAAYGAFSDWEQLSGGVQTIFGDAAAETVIANAKRAFGTVQLSANDYLNTVTSFSASLIQSLGGDTNAAAGMADKAITDMADNANKMGTSMESLQYAYQGFSRGAFTMLDNLRLGYGGTQEEMLRLVHDAGVVDESITDISQVSFADMIEGIHVIQQNMGIAGASAAEAATTLEGSFNMMSASWQNLLVAFGEGTPDAIKPAVDNLIASVGTWLSNAIPRICIIISGIVSYLPTLARDIIAALPGIVSDISSAFREQVGSIDLSSMLGPMMDGAMENGLVASIVSFSGRIGDAFLAVFGEVDLAATFESIRGAVDTAMGVIMRVIQSVQMAFASLIDSIDTATIISVMEGLKQIGEALIGVLATIGSTVADVLVGLVWPTIQAVWSYVAEHVLPGVMTLWQTIQPGIVMVIGMLGQVYAWVSQIVSALVDVLAPAIQLIITVAGPVFDAIISALSEVLSSVITVVSGIWDKIRPFIDRLVTDLSALFSAIGAWIQAVMPVVSNVAKWIGERLGSLFRWIGDTVGGVIRGVGDIISGIIGVITGIVQTIRDLLTGNFDAVRNDIWGLISSIGQAFWGVVELITAPFRSAFNAIRRLWNSTVGSLSFSIPDWVPSIGGSSFSMPKLAQGGDIRVGGTVMVGEAGPEILTLPRGARVTPLRDAETSSGATYNVVVGDVDLTDDDQVRRVTREYLEFLATLAKPTGIVTA